MSQQEAAVRLPIIVDSEGSFGQTRVKRTLVRLAFLDAAIYHYQQEHKALPENLGEVSPASEGDMDYHSDGWGQTITYTRQGKLYELRSAGEDRRYGSADDVVLRGYEGRTEPCEIRIPGDANPSAARTSSPCPTTP